MKNIIVYILGTFVLCASCNSTGKKSINIPARKYINVVKNVNGYNVAYTEDGHTLIYKTDSDSNVVLYYAKFDDNAEKKGYDRVRDKAIRVEIDSSLNVIKSFVSVYGGALCKINSNDVYTLHYFDEQMNDKNIELPDLYLDKQTIDKGNVEPKVKRIIEILTTAYNIAYKIDGSNKGGWNYIVSALEPTQSITSYDIMTQETVYSPNVKEHISKLNRTTEVLTQLYMQFLEKENEVIGQ